MIGFFCPYCKKALQLPEDQAGARVDCPKCSLSIKVPPPAHVDVDATMAPPIKSTLQRHSDDIPNLPHSGDSWWQRVVGLVRR